MRQRDRLPQLGKNGDFGATSRQIRIAEDETTKTKVLDAIAIHTKFLNVQRHALGGDPVINFHVRER